MDPGFEAHFCFFIFLNATAVMQLVGRRRPETKGEAPAAWASGPVLANEPLSRRGSQSDR